jgi:spermidine synthase
MIFRHAVRALAVSLFLLNAAVAEEKTLYQKLSTFSNIIVTEDEQGLRTMRFEVGGARQTVAKIDDPDHLELAYSRSMPAAMTLVAEPKRALIVGLGGGTIPRFLRKHFPQLAIDVVEIDPDVVAVAKQFFGVQEDDKLRLFVDDGRQFISRARSQYDIIFLDAFSADSIPYHLATREFLGEVRRALTEGGIVAANVWSSGSNRLYSSMIRTYEAAFPAVYLIDVAGSGNRIVLGLSKPEAIEREAFARRATEMSKKTGMRLDLGESVKFGFRPVKDDGADGRVLTDAAGRSRAG